MTRRDAVNMNQASPFTTTPPCTGPPECAIRFWQTVHDPASVEGEKAIRADQRRLDMRLLERKNAELARLNERVELLEDQLRRMKAELRKGAA